MTNLIGSEKQITWANDIAPKMEKMNERVTKFFETIEKENASLLERRGRNKDHYGEIQTVKNLFEQFKTTMANNQQARFLIENQLLPNSIISFLQSYSDEQFQSIVKNLNNAIGGAK